MRLAEGLTTREISLGHRHVWVVKEPHSEQFFFFEECEWELLRSLPDAILSEGFDGKHVANFYATAARQGLIVGHPEWPTQPISAPKRKWFSNPIAIRVPGIDPSRILEAILDRSRFLSQASVRWLAAALVVVALALALLNLGSLTQDIADASHRILQASSSAWLTFLTAVAILKIIHELAHGLACHASGGQCREMGLLFLLGVPCLYCDVSDTWLIRQPSRRILVSAAGMIAEGFVAAAAVIVWVSTHSGFAHDLAAMMVMTASISTIVVNANPLLRYDGYFMLSDWLGVPNLSSEANAALRQVLMERQPIGGRWGLLAYATASGLYRIAVVGFLVWLVCHSLASWIGLGIALPIAFWVGTFLLHRWFSIGSQIASRKWFAYVAFPIMLLIICVPIPQSIRVGGLVRPAGEQSIYARSTGSIEQGKNSLRLRDWKHKLEFLAAQNAVEELNVGLQALELNRVVNPKLAILLPLWRQRLQSAQEQLSKLTKQQDQLQIQWPETQTRFAPPRRVISLDEHRSAHHGWTGTPLEANNVHATIAKGTLLGRIGDARQCVVSAFVPGQWCNHLRIGQDASVGLPCLAAGTVVGTIVAISGDPVDDLPAEIQAAKWVETIAGEQQSSRPRIPHYEVQIRLTDYVPLPARMVSPVRIHLPNESFWSRMLDSIRSTWVWAI